jgi:hypothetical protein
MSLDHLDNVASSFGDALEAGLAAPISQQFHPALWDNAYRLNELVMRLRAGWERFSSVVDFGRASRGVGASDNTGRLGLRHPRTVPPLRPGETRRCSIPASAVGVGNARE